MLDKFLVGGSVQLGQLGEQLAKGPLTTTSNEFVADRFVDLGGQCLLAGFEFLDEVRVK